MPTITNTYIKENQLVKTSVCACLPWRVAAFLLCDGLQDMPPGVLRGWCVTLSVSPVSLPLGPELNGILLRTSFCRSFLSLKHTV